MLVIIRVGNDEPDWAASHAFTFLERLTGSDSLQISAASTTEAQTFSTHTMVHVSLCGKICHFKSQSRPVKKG